MSNTHLQEILHCTCCNDRQTFFNQINLLEPHDVTCNVRIGKFSEVVAPWRLRQVSSQHWVHHNHRPVPRSILLPNRVEWAQPSAIWWTCRLLSCPSLEFLGKLLGDFEWVQGQISFLLNPGSSCCNRSTKAVIKAPFAANKVLLERFDEFCWRTNKLLS